MIWLFAKPNKNGRIYKPQAWSSVALPIIKRVMPPTSLAKELVSVQPMSLPAGAVFYMDYKYGYIVIIFDEELWWEENDKGEWVCPQTLEDHKISNDNWIKERDNHLIIPKWEVEHWEKYGF